MLINERKLKLARLRIVAAATLLAIAGAALAQPDNGPRRWMANISRLQHVVMNGVPAPYTSLRDQAPDTTLKLRRGAAIFARNCSSCHGVGGDGTGPDAFALVPAPADLGWLARTPESKAEPYLYWSIAEGGQRIGSDMPAFKQALSQSDVWAVTAFIRAGFPVQPAEHGRRREPHSGGLRGSES